MRKKPKGSIFVISAPSGAGKTTLANKIIAKEDNLRASVSYTTRRPRKGEVDGVDYTFISHATFRRMADKGEFAEWAEVHGNFYGTSRRRLDSLMKSGFDVILDIDTQGARQIRGAFPEGVFIFILPPSMRILRERLEKRKGSDAQEDTDIARRLKRAVEEIREALSPKAGDNMYDYVIVNDVLGDSLKKLDAVITAQRASIRKIDPKWVKSNFLNLIRRK